uniref:Trypsin Inhibitor like cysteine rich domain protein n=1 Tax=Strongyloides venezuelensis TaxID=75913 RepID=A0A0K0EVS2_STRVS
MNNNIIILLTVIFFIINIIYAVDIKNRTVRSNSDCPCPLDEIPSCTCSPNKRSTSSLTEMFCSCLTQMLCSCMERIQKLEEKQVSQSIYMEPHYVTNIVSTTASPYEVSHTTTNYDVCTVNCNKICIETCKTTPIHKQNFCFDICKNTCEVSCQQPETEIHSTTLSPYQHTTTQNYQMEFEITQVPETFTTQPNFPSYPPFIVTTTQQNLLFDVINQQQNDCSLMCSQKCGENFPECISACRNICDCEMSCKNRCIQESIPAYSCYPSCQNTCFKDKNIVINLRKFLNNNNRKNGKSKLHKEMKQEKNVKSYSSNCLVKCHQSCQVNNTMEVCSNYCQEQCNCADTCTKYCAKRNISYQQCENACYTTCQINNKYNKNVKNMSNNEKNVKSCGKTCYNNCILQSKCDKLFNNDEKENCKFQCKKNCTLECPDEELIIKCAKLGNDDRFCVCPNGYRSCGNNGYCCLET